MSTPNVNTEVRSYALEIRATPAGKVEGYAAVYDSWSEDLGGFVERLQTGSLDKAVKNSTDIVARYNHNRDLMLGRTSSGTLEVWTDSKGMGFRVALPRTTFARDLLEQIERGDVRGASFEFSGAESHWEKHGNLDRRTILSVERVHDVGPCPDPAYRDTSVAKRSLDAFRENAPRPDEVKARLRRMRQRVAELTIG